MSAYRPEFEAALRLFARASEAMHRRGFQRPILVGGAAAEFYSQSTVTTGDFDLCTFRQSELEEELQALGFVRPSGAGQMLKGWVHPELKLGFEVVADTPMDGAFDRDTLLLVENTGAGSFVTISVFAPVTVRRLTNPTAGVTLPSASAMTHSERNTTCSS